MTGNDIRVLLAIAAIIAIATAIITNAYGVRDKVVALWKRISGRK